MNTIKDFTSYIIDINPCNKGMQILFKFPNDYGISLVCHSFSYGNSDDEFEIAIAKFVPNSDNWSITYDTDITGDVLGYQTKQDVIDVIQKTIAL